MEPRAEDELDRLVRDALVRGTGEVQQRLRGVPGVRTAELRSGLVKTEPPLVELAVEYAPPSSPTVSRVYDLVEEPDGAARVVGSHPAPG